MAYQLDKFEKGLKDLQIELSDEQVQQFLTYYEKLVETNKVMNLTAITEFEEVVEKHFLDSLSLVKVCDLSKEIRILDLGSGAGFPGIPLKIAFPELEIVLADSCFPINVLRDLGIETIQTTHYFILDGDAVISSME